MFPCELFAAFYQPDVLAFQYLILCLEYVAVDSESLIGCTELGKVLIPSLRVALVG